MSVHYAVASQMSTMLILITEKIPHIEKKTENQGISLRKRSLTTNTVSRYSKPRCPGRTN